MDRNKKSGSKRGEIPIPVTVTVEGGSHVVPSKSHEGLDRTQRQKPKTGLDKTQKPKGTKSSTPKQDHKKQPSKRGTKPGAEKAKPAGEKKKDAHDSGSPAAHNKAVIKKEVGHKKPKPAKKPEPEEEPEVSEASGMFDPPSAASADAHEVQSCFKGGTALKALSKKTHQDAGKETGKEKKVGKKAQDAPKAKKAAPEEEQEDEAPEKPEADEVEEVSRVCSETRDEEVVMNWAMERPELGLPCAKIPKKASEYADPAAGSELAVIPTFVTQCVKYLDEKFKDDNVDLAGMYAYGKLRDMHEDILEKYDDDSKYKEFKLSAHKSKLDTVRAVCNMMKTFLQNYLEPPLLPFGACTDLIEKIRISNEKVPLSSDDINEIVERTDPDNKKVLNYIIQHFNRVMKHGDKTHVTGEKIVPKIAPALCFYACKFEYHLQTNPADGDHGGQRSVYYELVKYIIDNNPYIDD